MSSTVISSTGFYAILQFGPTFRTITEIGYKPGARLWIPGLLSATPIPDSFGRLVIEPSPLEIWEGGNPAATKIREPFEAFLRTLYGMEAELTGETKIVGLYEQMKTANVLAQCGEVEIVDFMAFTDAIERFQVTPDGTQVDTLILGPEDARPLIADLKRKDNGLMWDIIEFLDLWGMLPYLYSGGGITFKELCDRLSKWKPERVDREIYYSEILRPALRSKNHPVLSSTQINQLFE